ncbi:MAG: carbohydrate kinase family protein [Paucibacter sp.]|nr:carbohydrate kinase family protein [Roseateles sp.]
MDRAHPSFPPPSITVIGDIGVDHVMGLVTDWPRVGTETLMDRAELRAGGSGGNAALALRHLGVGARLVSAVGDDDFGAWLARQFNGLDCAFERCALPTTVSIGVMHDCGERSFLTTRGHLEAMSVDHVRASLKPAAAPRALALLSGPFLLRELRPHYPALIAELGRLGHEVALDTGWPAEGWSDALRAEVRAWIAAVDHLLINELEAQSLTRLDDVDAAFAALQTWLKPGATLVMKTGPRGAVGAQAGRVERVPSASAAIFDTIGAGDAFNAGYLAARARGDALPAALATGCRAAVAILTRFPRHGIQPGELARCLSPQTSNKETAA